jgi:hypothetical protein
MRENDHEERIIQPFKHLDHPKPVSRRQFLGQGFLSGAAFVTMPTVFDLLMRSQEARAAMDCSLGGPSTNIPFIAFDLSGGANIAGSNALVGTDDQLDLLSVDGYRKLGLPEEMTPQMLGTASYNDEFGIKFHFDSAMLRGMLDKTTPATRANVNGLVICARSENDTGNNPHNPIYAINKAGATGALLQLIGTQPSDSGGRSIVPPDTFDPGIRPTKIDRPGDARGLVDTGQMITQLRDTGAGEVMGAIETISKEKIALMNEGVSATDIATCAYEQSTQLIVDFGNPDDLDPLRDPAIVPFGAPIPGEPPIFATEAEITGSRTNRKVASVMKLVVEGNAGAGTIEMGGYDYHDSTRSTGERKDFEAGQAIGAALEYARKKDRDLMIYVFSDGSVSSNGQIDTSVEGRDKGIWKGDNSSAAASLILVYSKDGRMPTVGGKNQIGIYRTSGSVETSHGGNSAQISNAPDLLAEAVVLNYLALHNRVGDYASVMNGQPRLTGGPSYTGLIGLTDIHT